MEINWHTFFFMLSALGACTFAMAVVFASNIVRMAFYLVLSLTATAGLFFLAGADFVGSMQIMIYVGGTMVLLVFGVMLTAQERFVSLKTSGGTWCLAALAGGALLAVLLQTAFSVDDWKAGDTAQSVHAETTATRIGLGLLGARFEEGTSGYLLPFEIASIHLLVVLIGAAYLARTKRRAKPSVDNPADRKD
jgi:NADH:ubiquinone oxidoreductase subunit 6 (subunit J)